MKYLRRISIISNLITRPRDLQKRFAGQAMRLACLPVARHDGREELLGPADVLWRRFRNLDSLLAESRVGLLPLEVVLVLVPHPLRLPMRLRSRPGCCEGVLVKGLVQGDLQRVLFLRQLLGEVAGVAPEREVGAGRVGRMPFLVGGGKQRRGVLIGGRRGGAEGAEGNVGRAKRL